MYMIIRPKNKVSPNWLAFVVIERITLLSSGNRFIISRRWKLYIIGLTKNPIIEQTI